MPQREWSDSWAGGRTYIEAKVSCHVPRCGPQCTADTRFDDAKVAREFEQRIFEQDLPMPTLAKPPGTRFRDRVKHWLGDVVMG